MAVSLPVVLLILDWYPFDRIRSCRTFRTALTGKLPFIALSIMSSAVTILAQKASGAMQLMEVAPLPTRTLVAARSLVVYLGKMIRPLQLVPDYPYPRDVSLLSPEYLFAVLLIIGTTAISLAFMKKERLWVSVWGYYVVTLIPVLGIVQVGGQAMADRYTYLPSLGPFLVVGLLAAWVYGNTFPRRVFTVRLFSAAAAVLLLVSMTYLTISQIGAWKDSIQLWSSVIEKEPARSSLAYYQRATAFGKMGQLDKALEDYNKTIALEPYHYEAYVSRGEVLLRKGYLEAAARDFETAVAIEPFHYQDYNKLGIIYGTSGQPVKAIESFTKSIALNPTNAAGYRNRGYTYARSGRYDDALEDLTRAIALDQNSAGNYVLRGNVFLKKGDRGLAVSDFQKACALGSEEGCEVLKRYVR
jgi:tetratricopeptide (TPR) repeat protein